jgi:uncharacterized Rmd1/YagE family protein
MTDHPLAHQSSFNARALLVGERIELRTMEAEDSLAVTPLTVAVEGGGIAVLFRYGAVVFFGVEEVDQTSFLFRLAALIGGAYATPPEESMHVRVTPNGREAVKGNTIIILDPTVEHLQVIADVLAKSAVLTLYEAKIAQGFDSVEPLALDLKLTGRIGGSAKGLVRHIGSMLLSEHMMVGRVSIVEKPEVLWENPSLEGLFIRLEDEFEIKERRDALERKLDLISRTAETLLDLLHNRHSMRVEWYVVILIVGELLVSLYEVFFH